MMAEPAADAKSTVASKADYPAPEKVHVLDPKIAKAHTTFYNNKKSALMTIQNEPESAPEKKAESKTPEPEKVQILDPKIAKAHTTFYNNQNQKKQGLAQLRDIPLTESS